MEAGQFYDTPEPELVELRGPRATLQNHSNFSLTDSPVRAQILIEQLNAPSGAYIEPRSPATTAVKSSSGMECA
jgi:hypothetical protein